MDELKKLLKTIRFEKFIIRESALRESELEEIPLHLSLNSQPSTLNKSKSPESVFESSDIRRPSVNSYGVCLSPSAAQPV